MKPLTVHDRFCLLVALAAFSLFFVQAAYAGGPSITTGLGYKPMEGNSPTLASII